MAAAIAVDHAVARVAAHDRCPGDVVVRQVTGAVRNAAGGGAEGLRNGLDTALGILDRAGHIRVNVIMDFGAWQAERILQSLGRRADAVLRVG